MARSHGNAAEREVRPAVYLHDRCRLRACATVLLFLLASTTAAGADYWMYVGTYTDHDSKGIYAWRFNPASGKLTPAGLVAETPSPSFLAVHPSQRFLYAVNESSATVSAFAVDRATGRLALLNTVASRGAGPCHLALDRSGKALVVANYGGGSVAAFRVATNGRLGEASAFFQHRGTVALAQRQGGPHAHAVVFSPDNHFALVADLGLDQILAYRFATAKGLLEAGAPPFVKLAPGSGPRHLAFHPNGRAVYVINEISSTITALSYDPSTAAMRELETVSTVPKDFKGENNTAEIVVHPSGKFLFGSNRGHDSIAVFEINPASGTLTLRQHVSTQGIAPRNFAIDPTGSFLLVANQRSNNIVLFRINQATGQLDPAGALRDVPTPVCVTFVPVE